MTRPAGGNSRGHTFPEAPPQYGHRAGSDPSGAGPPGSAGGNRTSEVGRNVGLLFAEDVSSPSLWGEVEVYTHVSSHPRWLAWNASNTSTIKSPSSPLNPHCTT